jgi:hypothetical protein
MQLINSRLCAAHPTQVVPSAPYAGIGWSSRFRSL